MTAQARMYSLCRRRIVSRNRRTSRRCGRTVFCPSSTPDVGALRHAHVLAVPRLDAGSGPGRSAMVDVAEHIGVGGRGAFGGPPRSSLVPAGKWHANDGNRARPAGRRRQRVLSPSPRAARPVAYGIAGYAAVMVIAQVRLLPLYRTAGFTAGVWSFTFPGRQLDHSRRLHRRRHRARVKSYPTLRQALALTRDTQPSRGEVSPASSGDRRKATGNRRRCLGHRPSAPGTQLRARLRRVEGGLGDKAIGARAPAPEAAGGGVDRPRRGQAAVRALQERGEQLRRLRAGDV
jgi:hypothetical protein